MIFVVGDTVIKDEGDYSFEGVIVAKFYKLNEGPVRFVVEDSRGLLMIMNPKQIRHKEEK